MPERILEVRDLSIAFNNTRVLDRISFEVEKGSVLAIIGPNGAARPYC